MQAGGADAADKSIDPSALKSHGLRMTNPKETSVSSVSSVVKELNLFLAFGVRDFHTRL